MTRRHKSQSGLLDLMKAQLAAPTIDVPGERAKINPLAAMDEAYRSGPIHALFGAWALVGEVLTFYQHRITEESALTTAREDLSAYAIARGVGYDPRPAISAHTSLAFEVRHPSGRVFVAKGTAVGNIPSPGMRPAIFETSDDLVGYSAWNRVPAAIDATPAVARLEPGASRIRLRGTTPIANGSAVVIRLRRAAEATHTTILAIIVAETVVDRARDTMLVRWATPLNNNGGEEITDVSVLETRIRPFGALAPSFPLAAPGERRPYALGGVAIRQDGAWTREPYPFEPAPIALALTRNGLYGITASQFVRRSTGDAWVASAPFAGATLQTLVATPGGRLAVGTSAGGVFISIDDGLTWAAAGGANRLPPVPVHAIAIDERREVPVVYAATDRGIASLAINGDAWTWSNDGLPGTDPKTGFASAAATSLAFTDAGGTLLAATTYGVFRSHNGAPWVRIPGVGGVAQVASLPGGGLIAIGPGGVFRSTDAALSWERVYKDDAIPRALAANVAHVAVVIGGVVYASDDGGTTWSAMPDVMHSKPTALAMGPDGALAVAAPFVENPAPDWPADPQWPLKGWPALAESLEGNVLLLDRELPLTPGAEIVVSMESDETATRAYHVVSTKTTTIKRYGLVATSTAVTLDRDLEPTLNSPRDALVHVNPRKRDVVPAVDHVPAPPETTLPVPRGLQHLEPNRTVAVEGRSARIMVRGMAGGPVWIAPRATVAATPPAALKALAQPAGDAVFPLLDVDAAVADGVRLALARFDGVWLCDDITAAEPQWKQLDKPAIPIAVASLAWFRGTLYACGQNAAAGIYAHAPGGAGWFFQPEAEGTFSRLVACADTLWACGTRGLYQLRDDGGWAADPQLTMPVHDVAADATTVIAAADDGVWVRSGAGIERRWEKDPDFDRLGTTPTVVAIDGGVWYAGTLARGTFSARAHPGPWTRVDADHRAAHVHALAVVEKSVLAAEMDRGIARDGNVLGVPLASGAVSFVRVGPGVLAFRGVPRAAGANGGDAPSPVREYLGTLTLVEDEVALLDTGILAPALQSGLERLHGLAGVKLDAADIVPDPRGSAWRIDAGPVFLLRREPSALSVFEVAQLELAARASRWGNPPASKDELPCFTFPLRSNDGSAPLFACDDDVSYAPAAADAAVRGEICKVTQHDAAALTLTPALSNAYDLATVTIAGNAVAATHGATIPVAEQIASGDSSIPVQTAKLANKPLTNVLGRDGFQPQPDLHVWVRAKNAEDAVATTAALARSELQGLEWQAVPALPIGDKRARAYVVRQDAEGAATLTFGDGERGRRLPAGENNVVARYRIGGGADGNVARGQLTLFQRQVAGHERVWNPVPATGGVPAENVTDLADVRRTVSRGLVSLNRIVSQRDLEDYVRAWPGVAKVDVVPLRAGRGAAARPSFRVTVDIFGDAVPDTLEKALRDDGAAGWSVIISTYRKRPFAVDAQLYAGDLADDGATILTDALNALLQHFSAPARAFRDDVRASAIVSVLQRVPGVVAVSLRGLYEVGSQQRPADHIIGDDAGTDAPASLLFIDPHEVVLDVVPLATVRAMRSAQTT